MQPEEVMALLEAAGAVRRGHFELSSGMHSGTYVQCALVLQNPADADRIGQALAERFHDVRIECVVSPAIGGIILGHEVARALRVRAVYVERDSYGQMALRRGFELRPSEAVMVVEDVWTTGGSTAETIHVVEQNGGRVVAAGALIDRSWGGRARNELGVRGEALLDLEIPTYPPEDCPLCRAGGVANRPGSRFVRAGE